MLLLNDTTLCGIQIALFLAMHPSDDPVPPRRISESLGLSPSYCAKVAGLLVRAGILRSHRGTRGGVELGHRPAEITLLHLAEACQGRILGRQCEGTLPMRQVCAFHRAMVELQESTIDVLTRWSIADLARKPHPSGDPAEDRECIMLVTNSVR